jgi:hypothetical protein
MLVETVLSMLTTVFQSKKVASRVGLLPRPRGVDDGGVQSVGPVGLEIDDKNIVRLSIAEFSR